MDGPNGSSHCSTLAAPGSDGSYLRKQESVFVHQVLEELDGYQQRLNTKSVLVFPPLPSRLRFLIHKTTESHSELATFSVGEDLSRRVVVCFSDLRGNVDEDNDPETSPCSSLGEASLTPMNRGRMDAAHPRSTPTFRGRGRGGRAPKRPDKALYTPHAARQHPSLSKPQAAAPMGPEPLGLSSCSTAFESQPSTDVSGAAMAPPASVAPRNSVRGSDLSSSSEVYEAPLPEVLEICPLTCSFNFELTMPNFKDMSLGRLGEEKLEGETEGVVDDDDDVRDDEARRKEIASSCERSPASDQNTDTTRLTDEILAGLRETHGVAIEHVHNDYSPFEKVFINTGEYGHVIEIYAFPALLKTEDLMDAFTDYSEGGMKITWVDDTHALAVFSSEAAAHHALTIHHSLLKTRTLERASKQSQVKACRRAEFIQPVKERPKTDSAVARRMVTRALGLQRGRGKRY